MNCVHDLVGTSMINHQKYEICFEKNEDKIVARVKDFYQEWKNISISQEKNFSFDAKSLTPFEVSFDKNNKRVIIASYGLKGGSPEEDLAKLLALSNREIANKIIRSSPKGKYASINVGDQLYSFEECGEQEKAKYISFSINHDDHAIKEVICSIIASVNKEYAHYTRDINEEELQTILKESFTKGSSHLRKKDNKDVIESVYKQCNEFCMILSLDGKKSDITLSKNHKVVVTYQVALYTSLAAGAAFAIFQGLSSKE